jgi:hypothetical protein
LLWCLPLQVFTQSAAAEAEAAEAEKQADKVPQEA